LIVGEEGEIIGKYFWLEIERSSFSGWNFVVSQVPKGKAPGAPDFVVERTEVNLLWTVFLGSWFPTLRPKNGRRMGHPLLGWNWHFGDEDFYA